ncbi:MAG: hypothetical protein M1820_006860 [Bogoriella megaspora]|nr:MAG: hypothetical protein M1820_006860 [Bogoriella megaspora]
MGRKPNPIINEYFFRGEKLDDASNRYQHTCKSCGERFPKGRIDTLINHLVKRCPCLSVQQRSEISLRAHEIPKSTNASPKSTAPTADPQDGIVNGGYAPAATHEMSALETLAEVSRQRHLHLSGGQLAEQLNATDGRRVSGQENGPQPGFMPEDFLVQDAPQHVPENEPLSKIGGHSGVSSAPSRVDTPLEQNDVGSTHVNGVSHSLYEEPRQPSSPHHIVSGSPHESHIQTAQIPISHSGENTSAPIAPTPLEIAASAAQELQAHYAANFTSAMDTETIVQSAGEPQHPAVEKFFGERSTWASNIDPQLQQDNQASSGALAELLRNGVATYPRPIAMNPNPQQIPYPEVGTTQSKAKPKVRGRFSDHRRKEVQDVRKRGACIRCRMLKKPCSGEDPCSTCVNVESARLWKSPCIRTRIAEEFNLYAAGLHAVLAFHDVNKAKAVRIFQQARGHIAVTHFPDQDWAILFKCSASRHLGPDDIDPALTSSGVSSADDSALEMIDSEAEDFSNKIEQYAREFSQGFFNSEPSPFMRPTIILAYRLLQETNGQDMLLQRAIELWVSTRILTDTSQPWRLYRNFSGPSAPGETSNQSLSPSQNPDSQSSTQEIPRDSPSYQIIVSQLSAAVEKRCSWLCKSALNELEKKLLQRQHASPFATFIASVILLACIERSAALFKGWEDPNAIQEESSNENSFFPSVPSTHGLYPDNTSQLDHFNQAEQLIAKHLLAAAQQPPIQPPETPTRPPLHSENDAVMTNGTHDTPITPNNYTSPASPSAPNSIHQDQTSPTQVHPAQNLVPTPFPSHITNGALPRYPLDKAPRHYVGQGERFAEILHMLLKMRGLPPKTQIVASLSGPPKLLPIQSSSAPATSSTGNETEAGLEKAEQKRKRDKLVREWFRGLNQSMEGVADEEIQSKDGAKEEDIMVGVNAEWLRQRMEADWKEGDPRCWDVKWVARLLMPN